MHVPEKSRYELRTGDEVIGFADAEERDGVVVIPFVKVDSQYSGQGLGARLVRETLDDIRSRGLKVTPICGFAASFIDRNREYRDLLA